MVVRIDAIVAEMLCHPGQVGRLWLDRHQPAGHWIALAQREKAADGLGAIAGSEGHHDELAMRLARRLDLVHRLEPALAVLDPR